MTRPVAESGSTGRLSSVAGRAAAVHPHPAGRWRALRGSLENPSARGLGAVLAGLFLLHVALAFTIRTPFIFEDELEYWLMAHQLAAGRLALTWAGAPYDFPSILYPLVLAPLAHLPAAAMYAATRILDCLLMSSVSLPVYLLARRLGARHADAAWACVLAAAVPSFFFTAVVMADPLYYTLFTWAVYAIVRVLDDRDPPPAWTCALWGLLIGGLYLVKIQGLLAPALLAVALLWRWCAPWPRAAGPSRWVVRAAATAAGCLLGLGTRLADLAVRGSLLPLDLRRLLGFYYYAHDLAHPTPAGLLRLLPVAGLYGLLLLVIVGVVPLLSLVSPTALRTLRSEPVAGLAWAVVLTACLALVAVFARNTLLRNVVPGGPPLTLTGLVLQERYLFPVSGVVFALWAHPGPQRASGGRRFAVASLAVAALALVALRPYLTDNVVPAAPSLTSLMLLAVSRHAALRLLLWVVMALFCVGVWLACRGTAVPRPPAVLALLLLLSAGAYAGNWWLQRGAAADLRAARAVARAVPPRATLLFDGALPASLVGSVEFWHPASWRLLTPQDLSAAVVDSSAGSAFVVAPAALGRAAPAPVRGSQIALLPADDLAAGSTVLLQGLLDGRWLQPDATAFGLRPTPGGPDALRLSFAGTQPAAAGPQRVRVVLPDGSSRAATIAPGAHRTLTVPLRGGRPGAEFQVAIDGSPGWRPATYLHDGDTRTMVVSLTSARLVAVGASDGGRAAQGAGTPVAHADSGPTPASAPTTTRPHRATG